MKYRFLHEADKGDNGGTDGSSTATGTDVRAPEKPADEAKAFTQADVDRIVTERLQRADAKAKTIADKAKADAEQASLVEQGKFKELAESATKRALDLETKANRVDALELALKAQVDALRKGLPDHVITLLDNLDVAAQLAYLAENRDKLIKPIAPEINGGGGNRTDRTNISDAEIQRLRARGHGVGVF